MGHVIPVMDVNIDHTLGALLVCLIIAAYLFGMSSSQAYIYYDRFPNDRWTYKTLVAGVWLLDTFHTALMSHTVYYYTVTHFGDYEALGQRPTFSFNLEILVVPILAFIVQIFFAYRAFDIDRKSWPLASGIAMFAVAQLVFGIIACVLAFTKFQGFTNINEHNWALITWLATGAVADLFVTVSLIYTFFQKQTAFAPEDGWMTKVLMYGVHTGLFTTITTVVDLIFVAVWPDSLAFAGINYILGKLYTNTLLYALNRRPVSDPRFQSTNSAAKHTLTSLMPTFAPNPALASYNLSAPRVQPHDPYAADPDFDDGYDHDAEEVAVNSNKAHSLTGGENAEPKNQGLVRENSIPESAFNGQEKQNSPRTEGEAI